jgi:hypothetical protein
VQILIEAAKLFRGESKLGRRIRLGLADDVFREGLLEGVDLPHPSTGYQRRTASETRKSPSSMPLGI